MSDWEDLFPAGGDIIADLNDLPAFAAVNVEDILRYNGQKVAPLGERVTALEAGGESGRTIEMKHGRFPTDTAGDPNAILWHLKDVEGIEQDPWKLLILDAEITGPEGPEGPEGPIGRGLKITGTVDRQNNLTHLTGPVEVGEVWLVNGVDEAWVYKGPVDHIPGPGQEGWQFITNWNNLGKVAGIVGPRGPRGPKGKDGGGGIGTLIVSIMISSAISIATSAIMFDVEMMINDAINDAMMEAANMMEDVAQSAVDKALEELGDQFKGEKGDDGKKGEDGEKGKDGASVSVVGSYEYLPQFMAEYPATEANKGKAALIGQDNQKKIMWAICPDITVGEFTSYTYKELGDITGPKGDDAVWTISLRNKDFTQKNTFEMVTDLPTGIASMYMRDTDTITIEGIKGSPEAVDVVGLKFNVNRPVAEIRPDSNALPTSGMFLSNDGVKTQWKHINNSDDIKDYIRMRSPSGTVFKITVDDNGRMCAAEEIERDTK